MSPVGHTLEGADPCFSLEKHLLSLSAPIQKSKIQLQFGIWRSGSQIIPQKQLQPQKSDCNNTGKLQAKPKSSPPTEPIPLDPSRLEQQITGAFPECPKVWDTGGNICSWPGRAGRGRCELFNSGAMTSINNGRCFPTCGKRPGKQLDPNQSTGSRP